MFDEMHITTDSGYYNPVTESSTEQSNHRLYRIPTLTVQS